MRIFLSTIFLVKNMEFNSQTHEKCRDFTPQFPHNLPHIAPHNLLRGNQKYKKIHDLMPFMHKIVYNGWGEVIRTPEWRSQSPLPYRLATPQYIWRSRVLACTILSNFLLFGKRFYAHFESFFKIREKKLFFPFFCTPKPCIVEMKKI